MVFVGAALLIAVVAYGAYRYIGDPRARAAAHKAVREHPGQWVFAIVAVALLIAGVWFIASFGP